MAVGGLIVCVLTSIHGGLLCRVTERHVYCSPRRDYSFGKSLELWPMVALLLSTLLGRSGIYVHTVERTGERRIKWPETIGGCGSRIVTRRYAIFIVKRACERKGRNTRFSYVCITSDIRGGRLITCSRYSGLKGV